MNYKDAYPLEKSNSEPNSPNVVLEFGTNYSGLKGESLIYNISNEQGKEVNNKLVDKIKINSSITSSVPGSKSHSPTQSIKQLELDNEKILKSIQNSIKTNGETGNLNNVISQNWIHCFCEVRFDLENGQAVDRIYPEYKLSKEELKTIAFSAFPDVRVFDTGDMVYQFRVRKSNNNTNGNNKIKKDKDEDKNLIENDAEFYTAYAYFRQRKDSRVHRGYYQKSIVLLTSLPMSSTVGLFTHLITIIGSLYHDYDYLGDEIDSTSQVFLESAMQDLSRWPNPIYSTTLEVPFAGVVLQIEMPSYPYPTLQLLETCQLLNCVDHSNEIHLLASVPDGSSPGLLLHWWDQLSDLWLLWELMLLGEPIVVMASDPATCSHVITELLDFIKPIRYCGDYRPYITIQDPDLKAFVNKKCVPTNTILGVTNPYFTEALSHWPHWIQVVSTSTPILSSTSPSSHGSNNHNRNKSNSILGSNLFKNLTFNSINNNKRSVDLSFNKTILANKSRNIKYKPKGVYTSHKSLIVKDKTIINQLITSLLKGDRSATILNNKLRRYFGELTERFLAPLNRYMTTLTPNYNQYNNSDINIIKGKKGHMNKFKNEEFLKLIEEDKQIFINNKTQLSFNKEIYKQFLRCGNFATWLHDRIQFYEGQERKLYLEQLCNLNIEKLILSCQEVEIIDFVLKLKEEINKLGDNAIANNNSTKHSVNKSESNISIKNGRITPPNGQHKYSTSSPVTLVNYIDKLQHQVNKALALLPRDIQSILN
ncbi:DUF1630-domain-containing protein [Neoconidiobolus thromboides FSU 785]|nr:DUF1630-domain-containing protein [Neoconidiobolus thromboides FSU 785]